MVSFRSLDSITLSKIDRIRISQPDLDLKPGAIGRELFVDAQAQELAKLYVELRNIANLQAISSATGATLEKYASNFGLTRGQGANATGTAILTTNTLDFDKNIPVNSIITARNGYTFKTMVQATFTAANASVYRANAIRLSNALEIAGITDEYVLEVPLEAVSPGAAGNIGKFSLVSQNIAGISNVLNDTSFTGGANTESDDSFRSRVLSVFAGSNVGTELSYQNTALADSRVISALTVGPGDTLMTRDGTQTDTNDDGDEVIISSGSGGKVDIYIQGVDAEQNSESFIWRDNSGRNDATDASNDYTLGQRGVSTLLDFQQRKRLLLNQGTIPFQPVDEIVAVSGSQSGSNFIAKFTDDQGNEQGNFELLKDTGAYGGSVFGFDKLHFISNEIELEEQGTTKGIFNGQDSLSFTDVNSISEISENKVLRNENATITADRSVIQLKHTPVLSVDRVVNNTTGERYTVSNLNPSGGETNTTGLVKISGSTLPVSTDNVEVSYLWGAEYDKNIDFDDLSTVSQFRTVQDSVDWGFSNKVDGEAQTIVYSMADGYHVFANHNISRLIDVETRVSESVVAAGGKLVVANIVTNVVSVKNASNEEVYNTALADGSFNGKEITLPTDTLLANGETATVVYNAVDLYSPDGYDLGSFEGRKILLPSSVTSAGGTVYLDYVANVNTILPTTSLATLPAVDFDNKFTVNGSTVGNQPVSNVYSGSNITRNLRFAPSYLKMNIQGITARGRITIAGSSFRKITAITTLTRNGLTIDLGSVITSELGLSSVPSTGYVAQVAKVERVTLSGGEVKTVDNTFDLINYNLKIVDYSNNKAIADSTLSKTEFKMSATEDNTENSPQTGQVFRVEFYYIDTNTTENVNIAVSGIQYSKYKYVKVDSISVGSGFIGVNNTISGNITISNANQPTAGSTYLTTYSYTGPKEGERITITYNYNSLIGDVTFDIEEDRPITADVLVKAAEQLEVDVSMQIVPTTAFSNNRTNLQQSVEQALTSFTTANGLNSTLDASDLINAVYTVPGVDRAVVTLFNYSGSTGIRKSISAGRNQYIVAGTISVEIEDR